MFPPGLPGLALLLLRASAATALLLHGYGHGNALPGWAQGAGILVSIALSVGYLTPIAAMLALVCHGLIWFAQGIDNPVAAIVFAFDAVALALLGPGAYSADSYRFGRRLVVLPPQ
jgi:putative oxidoreductase